MTWRNWGDHPIVVSISICGTLFGLIGLVYTVYNHHFKSDASVSTSSLQPSSSPSHSIVTNSSLQKPASPPVDSVQLTYDNHFGWTGSKDALNIYTVEIANFERHKKYFVHANLLQAGCPNRTGSEVSIGEIFISYGNNTQEYRIGEWSTSDVKCTKIMQSLKKNNPNSVGLTKELEERIKQAGGGFSPLKKEISKYILNNKNGHYKLKFKYSSGSHGFFINGAGIMPEEAD
jgi:hypothetical protein